MRRRFLPRAKNRLTDRLYTTLFNMRIICFACTKYTTLFCHHSPALSISFLALNKKITLYPMYLYFRDSLYSLVTKKRNYKPFDWQYHKIKVLETLSNLSSTKEKIMKNLPLFRAKIKHTLHQDSKMQTQRLPNKHYRTDQRSNRY